MRDKNTSIYFRSSQEMMEDKYNGEGNRLMVKDLLEFIKIKIISNV